MKYRKNVYQALAMVTQFGISMFVPILMCTLFGAYIGQKLNLPLLVILFFFIGALAGFRNIYFMAKKIFEQESSRDTRDVKKIE